jgi:hypothetical protein
VVQLQNGILRVESEHPPWLANAKVPVLVGGNIGFTVAYFIALYTIYHVAKAYKKLELKVNIASISALPPVKDHVLKSSKHLMCSRACHCVELQYVIFWFSAACPQGTICKHVTLSQHTQ